MKTVTKILWQNFNKLSDSINSSPRKM